MDKVVLTAFGMDKVGIVGKITTRLAEYNCSILDMTQTLMKEMFTMMIIFNTQGSSLAFNELKEKLEGLGEELGIKIFVQHENVFRYMHRL
ncbi:MAG: ACT domain-containing protein [Candidatus Wallbacteria bacterium]|nr:ACT domain-containing protein [Candidatus Wallbacteria bacterium]